MQKSVHGLVEFWFHCSQSILAGVERVRSCCSFSNYMAFTKFAVSECSSVWPYSNKMSNDVNITGPSSLVLVI